MFGGLVALHPEVKMIQESIHWLKEKEELIKAPESTI